MGIFSTSHIILIGIVALLLFSVVTGLYVFNRLYCY